MSSVEITENKIVSKEILTALFYAMSQPLAETIFFDIQTDDILLYKQNYLNSLFPSKIVATKSLETKVLNNHPYEYPIAKRHIQVPKLSYAEFSDEFRSASQNKEPFFSFINLFYHNFSEESHLIENAPSLFVIIAFDEKVQNTFYKLFMDTYPENMVEFNLIYNQAAQDIAINWIRTICESSHSVKII